MTLHSPHRLILRILFLVLAFAAALWTFLGVYAVLWAGCEQLYGAAFFGIGLFLYVVATEVLERGDRA